MVKGKLYCSQDNFRGQKILVTAKYSGKELELEEHGDLSNFPLQSTPGLEFDKKYLNESQAIAFYLSNECLKGGPESFAQAQVLQWMCFADQDLLPLIFNHVFPILELMPKPANYEDNSKTLFKHLEHLNAHLKLKTFFVGEKITLADIWICLDLVMLMQHGLLKEDRDKYTYLVRWFQTIVNQKIVKEVIGEVVLCEKLQPLKKGSIV